MITFQYPPCTGSSGVLRPLKLSKYLQEFGWQSSVVTVPVECHEAVDPVLAQQIPPDVIVHRAYCFDTKAVLAIRGKYPGFLAIPDRYISWLPFGVRAALRAIRTEGVTALLSTSPIPTAHLIALVVQRLTNVPWIADFRDPWVETEGPEAMGPFRLPVELWLERQVVSRANRVVTTTREFGEYLGQRHGDGVTAKIRAVYNGYDEEDFRATSGEAEQRAADDGERFTLVHAGLLDARYRDPEPILRALRACLDRGSVPAAGLRVRFIGAGAASEALGRMVADLRLAHVVEVAGRVPYAESLATLGAASALLLLQAGDDTRILIPAKAFEYLRTGKPILAAAPADSATARLIRQFSGAFIAEPQDAADIARQFGALWNAWKRGARVSNRLAEGLEQYSRRAAAAELAGILDEITGGAMRRANPPAPSRPRQSESGEPPDPQTSVRLTG